MDSVTKQCRDCGQTKPVTEYHRKRPGQFLSYCKPCHSARSLRNQRIAKDPKLVAERDAERAEQRRIAQENAPTERTCLVCEQTKPVADFRDTRNTCRRCEVATRDPEEVRAALRRYEQTHKAERAATRKQEYALNREKKLQKARERRAENPEAHRSYVKRWRRAHPGMNRIVCQSRRARKVGNGGTFTVDDWERVKAQANWTCLCCGKREPDIQLQADHVIPLVIGGFNIISNIQPLCPSCNYRKNKKAIDYRIID